MFKLPPKKLVSVNTEMHFAPALSYSCAINSGLKLLQITPLLGEDFFISVITF